MSARDTLIGILRQWAEQHGAAPMTPEALVNASDAEVLREWAARIREVGGAKGWSTWAAAYMDPDVEFVDTGMPSTETIVAELRRLDRAAAFRAAAEAIEREQAREETAERDRFGRLDHETQIQGAAVRAKVTFLRRLAEFIEREKDTSGGRQPIAGESTPDFFQIGHTYTSSIFSGPLTVDHVGIHPGSGERYAHGWTYYEHDDAWAPQVVRDGLFDRFTDVTDAPSRATAHPGKQDGARQ